jgi:hypothetical protein
MKIPRWVSAHIQRNAVTGRTAAAMHSLKTANANANAAMQHSALGSI